MQPLCVFWKERVSLVLALTRAVVSLAKHYRKQLSDAQKFVCNRGRVGSAGKRGAEGSFTPG